jgi:hypothetical protein
MRNRTTALLLLLLSGCVSAWLPARADVGASDQTGSDQATPDQTAPDQTWMSVRLAGRKIGHLLIEHERGNDRITTTQSLTILLNRNGRSIPMSTMSRSVETPAGEPLAFASRTSMSAIDSTVDGSRQTDGSYKVVSHVGGAEQLSSIDWPQGSVMAEGLRRNMLAQAAHVGQRYQVRVFDQATQQAVPIQVDVLGDEQVELPGGTETLNHQRQTLQTARGMQTIDLWLDRDGQVRKGVLAMMGRQLEMLACDRACALAPEQDLDMFRAAMIDSPRPLPLYMRDGFLRYRIHAGGDIDQPFITTDEQRVTRLPGGDWQVDVGVSRPGGQPPPTDADRKPNLWVQSDAPAIRELAAIAARGAGSDQEKMRRLRTFVSNYITEHGLDVGYASALEVLDSHQGDCTEYAILLTALARAQGIPARMVTGMVYADRYAGSSRVFLPHAWTQAWVGGRWQSYDAALRRFDTTHIAIDSGDGDPWHFFNASNVFAALRIQDAHAYWELLASPPPAGPAI